MLLKRPDRSKLDRTFSSTDGEVRAEQTLRPDHDADLTRGRSDGMTHHPNGRLTVDILDFFYRKG